MTGADVTVPEQSPVDTDGWRRLSPRMLLVHPVKEIGRAVPALVVILVAGSGSGHGWLFGLAWAVAVAALALSRWFTTRYRVGADQVQIREGLLRRRTLTARLDRVRTVDVTSHFLHRALGLARVEIGTGVSDPKGASTLKLDGLPASAAALLRGELLHRSSAAAGTPTAEPPGSSTAPLRTPPAAPVGEVEIARLRPEWIRFAPFTLSGVFTALAVVAFGWRLVSESHVDLERFGPLHTVEQQLSGASLSAAILEVAVAVLLFIGLASIMRYVLAYWGFRLSRHSGGTFHVSRGLLTTRATSIEVSRLRGVEIGAPLLLRLVGGARTVAIATGLEDGRRASANGRGSTILLPDAPLVEARRVTGAVIARPDLVTASVVGHGDAARRRRYSRAVGGATVLIAMVWLLWWMLGLSGSDWLVAVVLVPLAVPLAADRARNLGHLVRDGFLVTQSGSLVRRRAAIETEAIIGWNVQESFFQRRSGLVTLVATTAAGRQSYRLLDLPLSEARSVAEDCLPGLLAEFSA